MVTFFGKILFGTNEEEEALVFSLREGTQALPGGAIVVGFSHDRIVFDARVLDSLRRDWPGIPVCIEDDLVRFAQECGWSWHSSFDWRTRKVGERVWIGDHFKVSRELHP